MAHRSDLLTSLVTGGFSQAPHRRMDCVGSMPWGPLVVLVDIEKHRAADDARVHFLHLRRVPQALEPAL